MKAIKFLILFVIVSIVSNSVYSQSLKKGFDYYKSLRYDDAVKVFSQAMNKSKETLAARYGLGLVYSDAGFSRCNKIYAFRHFRYVYDAYPIASSQVKDVCKNVYNFTRDDAYSQMDKIAETELQSVINEGSTATLQNFVKDYEGADKQISKANTLIIENEWNIALKANDFKIYGEFAKNFPGCRYSERAEMLHDSLWKNLCHDYYYEGEIVQMSRFYDLYPDYPFYTQANKNAYDLALVASKLLLSQAYNSELKSYYEDFVNKAAPSQLAFVALQRMISPFLDSRDYKSASDFLKNYRSLFPDKASDIDKLCAILNSPVTSKLNPLDFPPEINTEYYEYAPVITADGNTLYFCGRDRPDNFGFEDIFESYKRNGKWCKSTPDKIFNTSLQNEAPLAVSPDGNTILIYRNSDIFISEKKSSGWTFPKKFVELNTSGSWDADAVFTSDGNAILFISDRSGNIGRYHPHDQLFHGSYSGNSDIYVSLKTDDGWSEPKNLGRMINTPYAERSPFLASDMKTLYFSSDGHYGFGRLDIFKCERLSDTSWTQWGAPVNMGLRVNTSDNDYNFRITSDCKTAYYTRFYKGSSDICYAELPSDMQPQRPASVSGTVTDTKGKFLIASIEWEDLQTGQLLGNLQTDPMTGNYFITLPAGKKYGFFASANGYYPASGYVEPGKDGIFDIVRNIVLQSNDDILSGKASITLRNVFFDTDKYNLKSESFPELKRLSKFINDNPSVRVEISGHTDNNGNDVANNKLSLNRAQAVVNYLISVGCPADRIVSQGYGSSKPVADNNTEQGRQKNRRVEFKILTQ